MVTDHQLLLPTKGGLLCSLPDHVSARLMLDNFLPCLIALAPEHTKLPPHKNECSNGLVQVLPSVSC